MEVDIFVRGWDHWKEGQAIAKILGALQGASKALLKAISETEREKITTKTAYKSFIRGHLLETAVPELGRAFRSWLKLRRLPKEGMRVYLTRHQQILAQMERTLNESQVQKQLHDKLMVIIKDQKTEVLMSKHLESLRLSKARDKKSENGSVKGSAKGSVKSAASAKSSRKETAGPDLVDGQRVWGKKTEKKPQADDYETKWSEDEWLPSEHGSQKDWDWKDKNRWWKAEWDESKPNETATVKDRLTELGSVLAEISLEIPDKQTV